MAFHKSVVGAGKFVFPPALINQRACAADVLQCSTKVHAKYWDYRPFHTQRKNWGSTDVKIFTLGYCNLRDKIGYPMTPSRVFHPMGLLPTCLASGNTGLVRTIKLRALDGLYCALVQWIQLVQKKKVFLPQWQPQRGGQCNRRMMPSECFASKAYMYSLELDLPDEVLYRCMQAIWCLCLTPPGSFRQWWLTWRKLVTSLCWSQSVMSTGLIWTQVSSTGRMRRQQSAASALSASQHRSSAAAQGTYERKTYFCVSFQT